MKKFLLFLLIPIFVFVFKLDSFAFNLSDISTYYDLVLDDDDRYLCFHCTRNGDHFYYFHSDGSLRCFSLVSYTDVSFQYLGLTKASGSTSGSGTYTSMYGYDTKEVLRGIIYPSLYDGLHPASYDDNIGNDLQISLHKTQITDAAQRWQIRWFSDSVNGQYGYDSVHVVIKGDTVVEFDSSDINGYYWFSPLDVIDPELSFNSKDVVCYVTPYLSGNWGNTKSINESYSPALINVILDPFVDYFRSFLNGNGDVIGVDDFTVDTTPQKPDTSGVISNPTIINQTTFYSPVTRVENVTNITYVTQYIDNSSTTNTNQYTTINNINKTTQFNIDIDLSVDLSVGAPARFDAAKSYLDDGPNKFMSILSVFEGTPFAPILDTLAGAIVVLVGAALVFVIIKIVGIIL